MELIDVPVHCDIHGAQTVKRIRSIDGEIFPMSRDPECVECSREAAMRKQQAREQEEREERIARMVAAAGLPGRYADSTFADFIASQPKQRQAADIVRKYAEAVVGRRDEGGWLVMTGLPGTGKTLLSAATCRFIAEQGRGVLYTTQSSIAREFRRSYQRDADLTEPELFDRLTTKGVLAIDELGASTSEHSDRLIFEICDARYTNRLPTIFATNHPRRDLPAVIGERLYDRMCEVAAFVPFDWASARTSRHQRGPLTSERAA